MAILAQKFAKIKKDDEQEKMMEEGSEQDKVQEDGTVIDERSPEEIKSLEQSLTEQNPLGEPKKEAKLVLESITDEDVNKLFADLGIEREDIQDAKGTKEELNKKEFESFKRDFNKRLPK